jgi:hypothetical protein
MVEGRTSRPTEPGRKTTSQINPHRNLKLLVHEESTQHKEGAEAVGRGESV